MGFEDPLEGVLLYVTIGEGDDVENRAAEVLFGVVVCHLARVAAVAREREFDGEP